MNTRYTIRFLLISFFIVATFILPPLSLAQGTFHIHVDSLHDAKFPLVEAYIAVSDINGLPIKGLKPESFSITEDHQPVTGQIEEIENSNQPLAIALLIDTSASMGSKDRPTPLEKSIEAAKSFVEKLGTLDQVAVIKFSDQPNVVKELTTDKNAVQQALDLLRPEKSKTAMFDAVVEGVKALEDYSGRRIIVLVTDGKDTHNGLFNFDSAMREASSQSIPIYPMGFGNVLNIQELQKMASLSGGSTQIQPSVNDLQKSFETVLSILRKQYKISYTSALQADGAAHELAVTVKYQGEEEQAIGHLIAHSSPISVTLPGYEAGQVVGGIENFQPKTDWPAPIKKLDVTIDGAPLTSIQSEPFEYQWDSTKTEKAFPPGEHEFRFMLTDIAGNTGQISVQLNVQHPVTVRITQPADGSIVSGSVQIVAELTALPDIQPGRVEINVDGKMIGSPLTTSPYETQWKSNEFSAGKHTITVIGFDATGQFTSSDQVEVDVAVGSYSWIIPLIALLVVAAVTIPLATRNRKRMARAREPLIKAGQASLREIKGLNPDQVWPLGANEIRPGRKPDENDIPLEGRNASRKHALIRYEKGQYVIHNLSTDNPVVINNNPVTQSQILQQGDEIRLGETVLKYEQS